MPLSIDASLGGAAFADVAGGGLRYSVELAPHPNGLKVTGAIIDGTPVAPLTMTVTITAIDRSDRRAVGLFLLVVFDSALARPSLPDTPYHYGDLPEHFKNSAAIMLADHTPTENPASDKVTALGRVLFYDRRLSANDRVACASCHQQRLGFADSARFSVGVAGGRTARQSMALSNIRFYKPDRFFWDERVGTLESLVLLPIQDPVEMGLTASHIVPKLEAAGFYASLFNEAFGTPGISLDRVAKALAQFLRALTSYRSQFDQSVSSGGVGAGLTAQQLRGLELFNGAAGCSNCHQSTAHVLGRVQNNGLDAEPADTGAGGGRFKAPSLRNIAVTAPYMHDGRFSSLEQVVEFYDSGVQAAPRLDPSLRAPDGSVLRRGLTASDRAALVAFLHTLTDHQFLADPRFSSPFR